MANKQTYTPSVAVETYEKKAKEYEKQVETALKRLSGSSLGVAVQDALSRIQNRLPFSYDVNADGLYQQYKQQYETLGRTAMEETVARSAEKTGGYANSYGVTAGEQAYGSYMEKLSDKIPQLYAIAYDRYQQEGNELEKQYNLLLSQEKREQEAKQEELGRLTDLAEYYASRGGALRKEEIALWENALARADALAKQEYQKSRDAIQDAQWQKEYALKVSKANTSSSKTQIQSQTTQNLLQGAHQWGAGEWEAYFARLRKEVGVTTAKNTLQALARNGVLPQNMISFGLLGVQGRLQGH